MRYSPTLTWRFALTDDRERICEGTIRGTDARKGTKRGRKGSGRAAVTANRRLWGLLIQVSFCLSRALVYGSVKGKGLDERVTIQARKTGLKEFRVDGVGNEPKKSEMSEG